MKFADRTCETSAVAPIPVTVVSGYLGAGKTTLINCLLSATTEQRIGVLVNDFGEINVDASLIQRHGGRTVGLTNGCVCCSIADDLTGALRATINAGRMDGSSGIEQIVIEASGVADPARIAGHAYGWPDLALNGIVTLVDTETGMQLAEDRFVGPTVMRQILSADAIVTTKTDLARQCRAENTRAWLARLVPDVPVLDSATTELVAGLLLSEGLNGKDSLLGASSGDDYHAGHSPVFGTITWSPQASVDRIALVSALETLGTAVPRCKGWLRFTDGSCTAWLVQGVGRRIRVDQVGIVGEGEGLDGRASAIEPFLSLIYLKNKLSECEILSRLAACRATTVTPKL